MRARTFVAFTAPSVLAMLVLIALPLAGVVYLALHNSYVEMRLVEVKTEVPLFAGAKKTTIRRVPQPVLGADGRPQRVWEFVGGRKFYEAAEIDRLGEILGKDRGEASLPQLVAGMYADLSNTEFWAALEFTLLYTFVTTPLVLLIGFLLALGVNRATRRLRGTLIFSILLPMIITPVVAALSIYWLFLDNAVVAAVLEALGFGRIYFLDNAFTIRTLIIAYGVWNAAPFAFIILYAGLQTVPQDSLEAAMVDGAGRLQRIRLVVIPHLAPLFAVIALTHLMDAYRVFEPILVFGSSVFANSLQYLIYYALVFQDNMHKAAAYAVLTVIGIVILLIPVLRRTWREQRTL